MLAAPSLLPFGASAQAETNSLPRLTMPKIQATFAAYSNLVAALASDPALVQRYKAVRSELPDTNGRDTMGLTAAKLIGSESKVASAFRKAGVTPAETTEIFETLIGVMFGDGMLQSMKSDESKLEPAIKVNLAFYRQHKNEITAVFQEFGKSAAALKNAGLNDDKDEEEDQNDDEGNEQKSSAESRP